MPHCVRMTPFWGSATAQIPTNCHPERSEGSFALVKGIRALLSLHRLFEVLPQIARPNFLKTFSNDPLAIAKSGSSVTQRLASYRRDAFGIVWWQWRSLKVVGILMERGFRAGQFKRYGDSELILWPDQAPDAVVARIDREWDPARGDPNINDICWFE